MTPAHRRVLAGALLVGALAWAVAWALAGRQASPAEAGVRAVADTAAVSVLGLALLPMLDESRYRAELVRGAARPLAVVAVVWLIAEAVRVTLAAAAAADAPLRRLPLHTALEFLTMTAGGSAMLLSVAAAAVVCLLAVLGPTATAAQVTLAGAAAIGVAARAVTGHLADNPLGAIAIALHILAAAVWCGALVAVLLTVQHRGQWSRVLPRFSQLALGCVAVLLAAGVVGALVVLPGPGALLSTGYGRVLLAKGVLALALVGLGWHNRTRWTPAARAHRISAGQSTGRARREWALMVMALTLAAALAVTG